MFDYKNAEKILEAEDVVVKFNLRGKTLTAIRGISMELYKGESLAIVGESGSGKSVFTKTFMGLLDQNGWVDSGSIIYSGGKYAGKGVDLVPMKTEKEWLNIRGKEIAMVFQDPMTSLNPLKTIGKQIQETVELHQNLKGEEAKKKTIEILEDVGIAEPERRYKQYPHEFSGGMRQRVVIAIAVACNPEILICDEPTTALDVTIQAQVLELMNELKEKLRTSLLLITHDLGVVAQVCDRVAIMYAGEIVESGTIAEVFDHPHHPYTIGLFGSIPSLDETAEKLKPIQGQMPDPTELPEGCAFAPRCPYATGACRTRKPEMTGVGGTQMVRCLAHQGVFESPELMEEVRHGR